MEEQEHQEVAFPAKPGGLLYHYTDQKALVNILSKQEFWATHVRHLNDQSEFVWGWNKAWNALLERIRLREFPDKEPSFKPSLEKVYRGHLREMMEDPRTGAHYVISLTDDNASNPNGCGFDGDRLSLWRGYSKGGHGFSLGFDPEALKRSFHASGTLFMWFDRCEYSESVQNEQIERLADKHLEGFLEAWSTYFTKLRDQSLSTTENLKRNEEHLFNPIMNMYSDFIEFGMFVKHHGFKEENEWRATFVAKDQAMCSFRESNLGLTPFLTVGLDLSKSPSPLKRIVVGPGPHKDEWVQTVNLLLAKCAISDVKVVPSKIPYRNW